MSPHRKRSPTEKRALLAAWRSSGLTRTAFCGQNGISWKSLGDWAAQLEPAAPPAAARFLTVEVVPDPTAPALVVELAGSGHRVTVPSDFDVVALRRLVGALC